MTRLVSTAWASTLLGLAFTGAAVAQTAPDDKTNSGDTSHSTDTGTTTTNTTSTSTTTAPSDTTTPDDTTASGDMGTSGTMSGTGTTGTTQNNTQNNAGTDTSGQMQSGDQSGTTPPVDVNVNVQQPQPPPPAPVTDYNTQPAMQEESHGGLMTGIGVAVAAGGGVGGFTDQTMRDTTNVGGDWDVRATIGTRSPIAFEGSYIGSAQSIDALGLDNDAILVGNGVQGALRVNATLNLPVQPFAFAGIGWRRYDLTNTDVNLSDVKDSDDVLEVPLGLGIAGKYEGLILDARGEYRVARDADLVPSNNRSGETADMNRWSVKGTIGLEF